MYLKLFASRDADHLKRYLATEFHAVDVFVGQEGLIIFMTSLHTLRVQLCTETSSIAMSIIRLETTRDSYAWEGLKK